MTETAGDMTNRLISIIVPVRNGAALIGPLVDAMKLLLVPPGWTKEILVGYQDSEDETWQILQGRDVRVIKSSSLGPAANRNAAAAAAQGELLYFIDADARPAQPDLLIELIQQTESISALGAAGGPILIDPDQRLRPVALADHWACWYPWATERPTGGSPFQPSASLLLPRSVFETVGGFDEDLAVFEDYEIEQRIQGAGFRLRFIESAPIHHVARGRILESLRHSWRWGRPMRREVLQTLPKPRFAFQATPALFWLNAPLIFLSRLRIVLPLYWKGAGPRKAAGLPFLFITLGAWALGVAFGHRDRPGRATGPRPG